MTIPQILGFLGSLALPLFNIPLMIKLYRRKSSADLSLVWVIGVEVCIILMLPAGLESQDLIFRVFAVMNILFFTGVACLAFYYREK